MGSVDDSEGVIIWHGVCYVWGGKGGQGSMPNECQTCNRKRCRGCPTRDRIKREIDSDNDKRFWAAVQAKADWSGTRRLARYIENRLIKAGVAYERLDGDSVYFFASDVKVRVSDHGQPAGGGYQGYHEGLGDVRHGEADLSIDPMTGHTWREATALLVAAAEVAV